MFEAVEEGKAEVDADEGGITCVADNCGIGQLITRFVLEVVSVEDVETADTKVKEDLKPGIEIEFLTLEAAVVSGVLDLLPARETAEEDGEVDTELWVDNTDNGKVDGGEGFLQFFT